MSSDYEDFKNVEKDLPLLINGLLYQYDKDRDKKSFIDHLIDMIEVIKEMAISKTVSNEEKKK